MLTQFKGFQKWIGKVDVKSSSVKFYVQRSSSFNLKNVPIPFEVETLNDGGAMNLKTGIFTAPRPGAYFFSFSGLGINGDLSVRLYVNDSHIGSGFSQMNWQTLSLQSTLQLKMGDKVSVRISHAGELWDKPNLDTQNYQRFTHFTGWSLQEYLDY